MNKLLPPLSNVTHLGFKTWVQDFVKATSTLIHPDELKQYVREILENNIEFHDNIHWTMKKIDQVISQAVDSDIQLPIDIRQAIKVETRDRNNRGKIMTGKQKLKYLTTLCASSATQSADELKSRMQEEPKDPDNPAEWRNLITSQSTTLSLRSQEIKERVIAEGWQASDWVRAMKRANSETLQEYRKTIIRLDYQGQEAYDLTLQF